MRDMIDDVRPEMWRKTSIAEIARKQAVFTTYGVLENDSPGQRGVVRSTHVRGGRIHAAPFDEADPTGARHSRAALREGDLAVVLVRRTGDSALVTKQHANCTVTRSVGIIRADPYLVQWLRIWLQTPTAKAWIDEEVTAHVEPTLSLDSLRRMPFALPPTEVIATIHGAVDLMEQKIDLNQETALKAVELADAIHDECSSGDSAWEMRQLGTVAKARTGRGSARSLVPRAEGAGIDAITPTDLFDLSLPYLQRSRLRSPEDGVGVGAPGTIMLAIRPDGVHIAVTQHSMLPIRGVLAVNPSDDTDTWWLLHELRSRGSILTEATQGENAREISARAFSRLSVAWPDVDTRARFQELAAPLHAMASKLVAEIRTLYDLKDALLRDISAKAGVLREEAVGRRDEDVHGRHRSAAAPHHT